MVLLTIRTLRELSLCGLFQFWVTSLNMEIRSQFPQKRVKFQFSSYQNFTENKIFPKWSH